MSLIKLLQNHGYENIDNPIRNKTRNTLTVSIFTAIKDLKPVAIRLVENNHSIKSDEFERELKAANEIQSCDHPNIVKITRIVEDSNFLLIEMPRYKCDLEHIVTHSNTSEESCIPNDIIFMAAYQIANALVYLEKKQIIHRDISLGNILVNQYSEKDGVIEVVLADFEKMYTGEPPILYPEEETDEKYDISTGGQTNSPPERYSVKYDVWELGAIIYQLITGDLSTKFSKLKSDELKLLLYGTDSDNVIVKEEITQKRLRNSFLLPYLWSCFQKHQVRIPPVAIMEEILAQFFFYISNCKKSLTLERIEKSKDFFILNFFQHLATHDDKLGEILKMDSEHLTETERYISNVFKSMFSEKGIFNIDDACSINLEKYSIYFNKFQGFYLLFTEHFEKAQSVFNNVLSLHCQDFTSFNNIALVQLALAKKSEELKGKLEADAKGYLGKAINNDPFYVSALVNLANIYENDGDIVKAGDYYDLGCEYAKVDRQRFNSYLNRAIFKAQQTDFECAKQDLHILYPSFQKSPIVRATKLLIQWMEILKEQSHQKRISLENEIMEDIVNSENNPLLNESIPFQLYAVMFLQHNRNSNQRLLDKVRHLITSTKVQPKILFCSTIVNRFALHFNELGEILTIPLFRSDISELLELMESCYSKGIDYSFDFNDLVQLSRANYKFISHKVRNIIQY